LGQVTTGPSLYQENMYVTKVILSGKSLQMMQSAWMKEEKICWHGKKQQNM